MKALRISLAVAGLAALLMMPAAEAASHPAPAHAAAPAQAKPEANKPLEPSENKDFGDWTVRCYPVQAASPCEMLQSIDKDKERLLTVLVAYFPVNNSHIMQVVVPLRVNLPNGVVLKTESYTSGTIKFRRCDMQGCYAMVGIDDGVIQALERASKTQVEVVGMDNKRYELVFSPKGFSDAHHQLVEWTRQKAVNQPPKEAPPADAAPASPPPANP